MNDPAIERENLWCRWLAKWRGARAEPVPGDFSARLIEAQEEDGKRLSRELHDGVGQIITALKMELSRVRGAEDGSDTLRLERARSHADEALKTIRSVARMLRPTLLDDLGLESALQWHVEDFSRRTGIRCELHFSLRSAGELPDPVNTCVYRTVQEALNNCEKHSAATAVTVSVTEDDNHLLISVADNGRGLNPASAGSDRYGIRGMRERAQILQGSLRLESELGKGTTIKLNLPR